MPLKWLRLRWLRQLSELQLTLLQRHCRRFSMKLDKVYSSVLEMLVD